MSDLPDLTPAARDHLAGRSVVLRGSPRNGCCGGRALLPVAELGPPADPSHYRRAVDGEVTWYIEPSLLSIVAGWTVDAVGPGRWRRLYIDGAEHLDPTDVDREATP
jgi:hypothetical protein